MQLRGQRVSRSIWGCVIGATRVKGYIQRCGSGRSLFLLSKKEYSGVLHGLTRMHGVVREVLYNLERVHRDAMWVRNIAHGCANGLYCMSADRIWKVHGWDLHQQLITIPSSYTNNLLLSHTGEASMESCNRQSHVCRMLGNQL